MKLQEIMQNKTEKEKVYVVATYRSWEQGEEFDCTHFFKYRFVEAGSPDDARMKYKIRESSTYFYPRVIAEASPEFIEYILQNDINIEDMVDNKFIETVMEYKLNII